MTKSDSRHGHRRGGRQHQKVAPIKYPTFVCPKCNEVVSDLSSAIADKITHQPVHFDCILNELRAIEEVSGNTDIAYIGKGQFALIEYESKYNRKNFKILKTIEWEEKGQSFDWRNDIKDQVH